MTDRETKVVAHLIERGMTNAKIAAELFITPKAVEYHLGNVVRRASPGLQATKASGTASVLTGAIRRLT